MTFKHLTNVVLTLIIYLQMRQNQNRLFSLKSVIFQQMRQNHLGKQYSANAIQQRCNQEALMVEQLQQPVQVHQQVPDSSSGITISTKTVPDVLQTLTK